MSKTYYVYISYENNSDRFYVGSSQCCGSPNEHNYLGSGMTIATGEFKPDWKWIYGEYATRQEAGLAEMELIKQADYKNNELCMNKICQGANHTEEAARKMSEARSGEKHYLFGKTRSAETKTKMSKAKAGEKHPMYGKTHSAEARAKISKALSGEKHHRFDNRLHKFVHESGKTVIGTYLDLKNNAKELLGISRASVQNLKEGHCQSVKGWSYAGTTE